jgi:hypothetical protein
MLQRIEYGGAAGHTHVYASVAEAVAAFEQEDGNDAAGSSVAPARAQDAHNAPNMEERQ